jgi:hypothetical protein
LCEATKQASKGDEGLLHGSTMRPSFPLNAFLKSLFHFLSISYQATLETTGGKAGVAGIGGKPQPQP